MIFHLPLRLRSSPNLREHWSKKASRIKHERAAAIMLRPLPALPCTVRIIRIGRRLFDRDNNIASMKGLIDGIADRFGVNDNDPRITWEYAQEIGKEYGVRIEITQAGCGANNSGSRGEAGLSTG